MKKPKKKSLAPLVPPIPEKPKLTHIDHVKGLFHYFGYKPSTPEMGGFLAFKHATIEGNLAIYERRQGSMGKITFCEPNAGSFVHGSQSAMPKTWTGLFNALRNHTRRLIAMRDAQYKQKAA